MSTQKILQMKQKKNLEMLQVNTLYLFEINASYTSVKDSGVCLTFATFHRRRRGTLEQIWEQILMAFDKEANIDLLIQHIELQSVK